MNPFQAACTRLRPEPHESFLEYLGASIQRSCVGFCRCKPFFDENRCKDITGGNRSERDRIRPRPYSRLYLRLMLGEDAEVF